MADADLALVEPQAPLALFGTSDPLEVIAAASRVATALAEVVNRRQLYAIVNGKKFPTVEAWTLCGSMLGVFPITEWVHELRNEDASVRGFDARVRAQTLSGRQVGAGEARCIRGESKTWHLNAQEFAVSSMAQTRATSKALRGPLDFIFKLAGFQPTPAEEMDGSGEIAPGQASPQSVSALQEAQGVDPVGSAFKPPASPAAEVNSGAAAVGSLVAPSDSPPPWQEAETKVKEKLKRGRPRKAEAHQASFDDPGRELYLVALRAQAREAAAALYVQTALRKGLPEPAHEPNSDSDAALTLLIARPGAYPDLPHLNANKLEELDEQSLANVIRWLERRAGRSDYGGRSD